MNWTRWLLLPGLLALLAAPAWAIDPPGSTSKEYRLLPLEPDSAAALKKRLQELEGQLQLENLLNDIRNHPENYKDLLDKRKLPQAGDNPLHGDGKIDLDADKLKALNEVLKKQLDGQSPLADPKGANQGKQAGPMPAGKGSKFDALMKDLFNEVDHGKLGKLGNALKHSDAWKEAKGQMEKEEIGLGGANKKTGSAAVMDRALANTDLNDGGSKTPLLSSDWLKLFTKSSTSSGFGEEGGAEKSGLGKLVSPPSFSMPASTVRTGGLLFLQILLVLILTVAVVVVVWRLLARVVTRDVEARLRRTVWPMPPGEVSTRQQLIQAFEHLALVVLGPGARSANHRDIANGLGATPERTRAADELATLYERARYDPAEGELPTADLAAARRDLCLLAGMAAP
jgi:hypothetical protein